MSERSRGEIPTKSPEKIEDRVEKRQELDAYCTFHEQENAYVNGISFPVLRMAVIRQIPRDFLLVALLQRSPRLPVAQHVLNERTCLHRMMDLVTARLRTVTCPPYVDLLINLSEAATAHRVVCQPCEEDWQDIQICLMDLQKPTN